MHYISVYPGEIIIHINLVSLFSLMVLNFFYRILLMATQYSIVHYLITPLSHYSLNYFFIVGIQITSNLLAIINIIIIINIIMNIFVHKTLVCLSDFPLSWPPDKPTAEKDQKVYTVYPHSMVGGHSPSSQKTHYSTNYLVP